MFNISGSWVNLETALADMLHDFNVEFNFPSLITSVTDYWIEMKLTLFDTLYLVVYENGGA